MKIRIGLAITGSFCTYDKILKQIELLTQKEYEILPIFSYSVDQTDTRFFNAKDFKQKITELTGHKPINTISLAEPVGPQNLIDVLAVAPCTGNTLAKIANAITDTPVLMTVKAHLRNNKPLVIGISTNDALGLNLKNLGTLLSTKNVYFVPFCQDDSVKKPNSLIANFDLLESTILEALNGKQIEPVILTKY
ncbi:MAG: dipicolinate synthase subunit B [Clostridia bacterium]|jgi:dipicolinate synthase subunit B|nr:dipicolinate synthase subunit B [Clostridia bacterium]MDD4276053.1 dipicolinate synthase subunit B [Clostridia bacterium]